MRAIVLLTIGFILVGPRVGLGQDSQPATAPAADRTIEQMTDDEVIAEVKRYRDIGRFLDARAGLRYLIGRNDRNLEAYQLDGEIALMMTPADVPAARMAFLSALKIQPADFRANFGLAQTWFRARSWRQAQIYLEIAQKSAPADKLAELYSMLAQCFRANGMKPEAYAAVDKAIAADPASRDALEVRVALLAGDRRYDQALVAADDLVNLNREAVRAAPNKRDALIRLHGAHNVRLSVLQEMGNMLFQLTPDGRLTERVIEGRQRDAAAVTKRVMEDYIVLNDLNRTLQFFTIIAFAERVVNMTPDDADAWLKLGMLYRNTYQDQAAANIMAKVLQLDPENAAAKRELETLPPPTQIPSAPAATQPAPEPTTAPVTATIP